MAAPLAFRRFVALPQNVLMDPECRKLSRLSAEARQIAALGSVLSPPGPCSSKISAPARLSAIRKDIPERCSALPIRFQRRMRRARLARAPCRRPVPGSPRPDAWLDFPEWPLESAYSA